MKYVWTPSPPPNDPASQYAHREFWNLKRGLSQEIKEYADDAEAAAAGVLVGELYHTAGTVKVRVT